VLLKKYKVLFTAWAKKNLKVLSMNREKQKYTVIFAMSATTMTKSSCSKLPVRFSTRRYLSRADSNSTQETKNIYRQRPGFFPAPGFRFPLIRYKQGHK